VFRGDKVRFWHDSWLGNMPLRIQFDSLFQICEDQEALVEEVWNGDDWDLSSRRSLSGTLIGEWQLLRGLLEEVSLDISRGDEVKWVLDKSQVFQPGGYWVFSRPSTYNISNQGTRDMQDNQLAMDDMSNKLRWTKVYEEGTISVWRKPSCHLHCDQEANVKLLGLPPLCIGEDPDSAWYANISICI